MQGRILRQVQGHWHRFMGHMGGVAWDDVPFVDLFFSAYLWLNIKSNSLSLSCIHSCFVFLSLSYQPINLSLGWEMHGQQKVTCLQMVWPPFPCQVFWREKQHSDSEQFRDSFRQIKIRDFFWDEWDMSRVWDLIWLLIIFELWFKIYFWWSMNQW